MDENTTDFSQRVRQTFFPVFVVFNGILLAVFLYSSGTAVHSFLNQLFILTANEGTGLFHARFSETERLLRVLGMPEGGVAPIFQDPDQLALLEKAKAEFHYYAIGVADNNGTILGISPVTDDTAIIENFVQMAAHEEEPLISPVFAGNLGEKLFLVSVPLLANETRLGTAFAVEYVDHYLEILRHMSSVGEVNLSLLGRAGQLLASTGHPLFLEEDEPYNNLFPHGGSGLQSGPYFFSQGRFEVNRYMPLPHLPWLLVITVDSLKALSGLVFKLFLLGVGYLACLLGISWYARAKSYSIAQPVDELMQKARQLGSEKNDESGDVFSFITAAMEATSNIINPTEFFFSIDRRSEKLELAFGDFAELTGYELPKTVEEIRQLFLSILHPDDVPVYMHNHSNRESGPPDGEETVTFLYRLYSKEHKMLFVQMVETDVFDKDGTLANTMVKLSDMTEQKELESALVLKSETDGATGLLSKAAFESKVRKALVTNPGSALALLDIDSFKQINDKHGHLAGDRAIISLASLLKTSFRAHDIVGRVGGDEFAVLCLDIAEVAKLKGKLSALVRNAARQLSSALGGHPCSISVGVAFHDENAQTFEALYANADAALYASKKGGKNTLTMFGGK